ncbi:hypothetical protein BGY98DRAFT_972451 [Russula aff. rugulosa BPL654]|nr:hypothetical protein BGY98DRAFT_972451 [Russula aff. rugulosa BPL654]
MHVQRDSARRHNPYNACHNPYNACHNPYNACHNPQVNHKPCFESRKERFSYCIQRPTNSDDDPKNKEIARAGTS